MTTLRLRHLDVTPQAVPIRRALIVDDDALLGRLMRKMLARLCLDAVTETSPHRALARIAAGEQFDLVLCDYNMPDMMGDALIALVRAHLGAKTPPIVLMSGDEVACDGVAAVLPKPFNLGDLQRLLAILLAP